jgi:ankyrin repeat protein
VLQFLATWRSHHPKSLNVEFRNTVTHTAVMAAANAGRLDALRFVIDNFGASLNAFDENDMNPLHLAAASGHVDVVCALIDEYSVPVDIAANERKTSLHCAAQFGYATVVRELLARGASVDAVELRFRSTPLLLATFNQHSGVVACLLDAGADASLCNVHGDSARELAETSSVDVQRLFSARATSSDVAAPVEAAEWDALLAEVDDLEYSTSADVAASSDVLSSAHAVRAAMAQHAAALAQLTDALSTLVVTRQQLSRDDDDDDDKDDDENFDNVFDEVSASLVTVDDDDLINAAPAPTRDEIALRLADTRSQMAALLIEEG